MDVNFAHIHLVLTHVPPVASVAGAASAAFGARRPAVLRVALVLLVATGVLMPLVYIAGNRAADMLGHVDGVQQEAIEPHQQAATAALVVSLVSAAVAAVLLVVEKRRRLTPMLRAVAIVVSIASALAIGWAAARGGAIHHPEIHSPPR